MRDLNLIIPHKLLFITLPFSSQRPVTFITNLNMLFQEGDQITLDMKNPPTQRVPAEAEYPWVLTTPNNSRIG